MESRSPVLPPAVGEKKRFDVDLGGVPPAFAAKGLGGLEVPVGAAARWSRDMLELAPTTLYMPRFFPGTADMAFMSAMFWAMAARFTERCRAHATRPRQAMTQAPRKARKAPTQMKTVPSGKSDFCMKAAPAVLGICATGVPRPAMVVKPDNETTGLPAAEPDGSDELESDEVLDDSSDVEPLEGLMDGAVASVLVVSVVFASSVLDVSSVLESSFSVFDVAAGAGAVVACVFPVVWAAVEAGAEAGFSVLSGTFCARTAGATSRTRPTRTVEGLMAKAQSAKAYAESEVGRGGRRPRPAAALGAVMRLNDVSRWCRRVSALVEAKWALVRTACPWADR